MDSKEQAAQWQLSYILDRYLDGECASFAQALATISSLPVVVFRLERDHGFYTAGFPRHAAVRVEQDLYLDASGLFSLKQAKGRFEAPLVVDNAPDLSASPFDREWPLLEEHGEALDHADQMLALRGLEHFKAARPRPNDDSPLCTP
ncbi:MULTISPECIES: hypothetical protein [Pseudomonas]|uniref:hypothetical protein n=1 Tax=Pseudomonas TaxID=286 RepID=UPI000F02A47C|nr:MULTISPECIES: hypothetical protein [Pseudomonas]MBD8615428.1 hypothetical protein [Pseudomonas putida]MBD8681919.1 hypothetical protein [Pseudomonas sp. CFBP 13719]